MSRIRNQDQAHGNGQGHLACLQAAKAFFAGLGAFDHLAFTAGETLQLGRLSETDIAAARAFFGLRYWGAYMAAKYGSSGIRLGGSIVFTSGLAGKRPHAGWSLGASICSAMEGLTRALAVELVFTHGVIGAAALRPRCMPPSLALWLIPRRTIVDQYVA